MSPGVCLPFFDSLLARRLSFAFLLALAAGFSIELNESYGTHGIFTEKFTWIPQLLTAIKQSDAVGFVSCGDVDQSGTRRSDELCLVR